MDTNMFSHIYRARAASFGTSADEELAFACKEIYAASTKKAASERPHFIMFKMTDCCNSNCIYCSYSGNHPEGGAERILSTDDALYVFDQAATIGVDAIALNGGESLMRSDIVMLTKELCNRKILPILMTNGLLLPKKWDELGKNGLKYVIISLDSLCEENYCFQRGVSFQAAMKGVESALHMREKYGDVIIHITAVLTKYTLKDMIPLAEFCNKNKVWLEISVYDTYGINKDVLSVDDQKELENVAEQLCRMKENGSYISSSTEYIRHLKAFSIDKQRLPSDYSCFSGYSILLIDDKLDVRPCWGRNCRSVGNLHDASLKEIWNNDIMNECREIMLHGNCGGCWNLCTELNAMYNENMEKYYNGQI